MRWFGFGHLPDDLKAVSGEFYAIACTLTALVEPGPERTVALRKLLEAKDAAVSEEATYRGIKSTGMQKTSFPDRDVSEQPGHYRDWSSRSFCILG
ncbi:hypothetical protein Pan241w_11450 [Gimesia alba]|uniref:Uncharacterized protein n=2 Tax=Gimesia alba TaxID=2527973 RepID=A0A517RB24_9PLAN|nr:hypothetical protein Pan241w_11450 [Gimesia alba]